MTAGVRVREAGDADVEAIREVFLAAYGADYPYESFFDRTWLRRSIYTDDILMLVAEDEQTGAVAGSASVVLDVGAHSDLIGEMGRLVVHPDHRGRGIGRLLMAGRVQHIAQRLHLGLVENRCVHPFSQRISHAHGFAPVGFLPLKHPMAHRESVALFARAFGPARDLRRNHPRVVPEAWRLADAALRNLGLPVDPIVDDHAPAWPPAEEGAYTTEALTTPGFPALLRVERGRLHHREVFGPMRLQYGFFKLAARHADYLVARHPAPAGRQGALAGAIGYIHDTHGASVRIFELIPLADAAVRFLLTALLERCATWGVAYVEVDVSAHAPRMQRTLLELGFLPAAYVPAMVFHEVERLDVVKMVRLRVPLDTGTLHLTDAARAIADPVLAAFRQRAVLPRVQAAVQRIRLFSGLDDEQTLRVASACRIDHFASGARIFAAGTPGDPLYLLLDGEAEVRRPGESSAVGSVGPGESLGERALLTQQPHTADAVARTPVEAAVLRRSDLAALERQRPDIGLQLYRNLAIGLGRKLARASEP